MREVERDDNFAIFELRGGTHLLLFPGEAVTEASFDLMVDDLEATHKRLADAGLDVAPIGTEPHHRAFTVHDPSGAAVTVRDSHVGADPV